mgnify:CR=1 FL=1
MDLYIRASEIKNNHNLILYRNRNESTFNAVSYTHLTLPTILRV